MNASSLPPNHRREELLAESMVRELQPQELRELKEIAGDRTKSLLDQAEQAAVATQIAFAENDSDVDPIPTALKAKLQEQAAIHFAESQSTLAGPGSRPRATLWPWLLSAAAGILAVIGWLPRFSASAALSSEELLQALVAQAPADLLRLDWAVLEDPASIGAGGEVLWSDGEQRGYMRFRGLSSNDPQQSQYQLWIFDDKTDTHYPVDGGVFDIPAGVEEVIVAIDPKIRVKQAFQFAITVEKPGGVVVSKRERIPLLAAAPG